MNSSIIDIKGKGRIKRKNCTNQERLKIYKNGTAQVEEKKEAGIRPRIDHQIVPEYQQYPWREIPFSLHLHSQLQTYYPPKHDLFNLIRPVDFVLGSVADSQSDSHSPNHKQNGADNFDDDPFGLVPHDLLL